MLFPYIDSMQAAVSAANRSSAVLRHGAQPGADDDDGARRRGREAESDAGTQPGYAVPADGCTTYASLYRALGEFERDLHQHIHLENNILFPRAVQEAGR